MKTAAKIFAKDLAEMMRLSDARKAENAAIRAQMQANKELCAVLLSESQRRGELGIDWVSYFSNAGVL